MGYFVNINLSCTFSEKLDKLLSFWEKNIFEQTYDVGIIGAGFAGSWLAYELLLINPKLKIIILEKGILPHGASTKNAGFACFGSPSELLENIKEKGLDSTITLTEKRYKGVRKIKEAFGTRIDFNECSSYELFENIQEYQSTLENLNDLNNALQKTLGIENHFKVSKTVIETFGFKRFNKAFENAQEGSIHSYKLLMALHQAIQSMGGVLYFNQAVSHFEENADIVKLTTAGLGNINVRHLAVCTNAFTNDILPDLNIAPGRGQMVVTKPISRLKIDGTFHFYKGYFYFRNHENRILFGGGRNLAMKEETTKEFGENHALIDVLNSYLKTHILPNIAFEIDYSWSGIMAFNQEKTPISKIISPSLSYNVCMNGMGVALTPTLGEELAKEINEFFK